LATAVSSSFVFHALLCFKVDKLSWQGSPNHSLVKNSAFVVDLAWNDLLMEYSSKNSVVYISFNASTIQTLEQIMS
jgi:hypothetical protein